jgi:large subunit ribosomal protein L25
MEMVEVRIERRDGGGKGRARKMRRAGVIPAIFYGPKRTTAAIAVRADEFKQKLARLEGSHLIRLVHDGGKDADLHDKSVLLREVQRHPVTGDVLHVDFFEVDLTERLTVSVALRFVGKAVGVVEGGILQPILREIEVECLPTEIPEFIEIDVSHLTIHQAVHLSEVKLPDGVVAMGEPSQPLVSVLPPSVEEAKPAEGAEAVPVEGAPAEGAAVAPGAEGAPAEAKGGDAKGSEGKEGKGRKGGGES